MKDYPDKHLNNCYERIAEENDLVEVGFNRWNHKPTGRKYVLTPFGFIPEESRVLKESESGNGFFTFVAIVFVIGFVAGLFF